MLNKENALQKHKMILEQIKKIDSRLNRLPNKKLYCIRNGNSFKWYEKNGKKNKYISKKRRAYAEKLAERKYLTLLRKDLLQEKIALDFYLRHHCSIGERAEELLTNNSGYAELLKPLFTPKSKELQEWMNSPYEKSELYTENLVHKTTAGIMVRSKSEALIVMVLHKNKIPFRYEDRMCFGAQTYYPDFTIRHPKDGRMIYWEHFGLMDDADYREKAFKKLKNYAAHGLIPGVNLITTFESKEHPLELGLIENLVEYHFL